MTATPADMMRQAAALLRERAEAATPGPWESVVDDHGRKGIDASVWADSIGCYVTDPITSGERHIADAAWIATVHPGVGLPLAALLEQAADRLDVFTHPGWQELCAPHELAVARAVLGEEAGR